MPLPDKGRTRDEILCELQSRKGGDVDWRSGRVLGFIFNLWKEVEEVSHAAYSMYLTETGLDPTSFPSAMELEVDLIRTMRGLLRGDEEVVGNFTSGGTESIFCAMKAYRDRSRALRPEITSPEIVLPQTAHPAFHKASEYMGMTPVMTKYDPVTFRADVDDMRAKITPNTISLVASAPAYAHGVADPIREIGALALEKDLLFHVDGCVGGIMLSFMRGMEGFDPPDFDFSVPGVTSISADLHKFGFCAKGASTILYRNRELRQYQIFANRRTTAYAIINNTVLSSKTAGPVAAAWAVMNFLGREGYEKSIRVIMDATARMIEGINAVPGLHVMGRPDMCVFAFTSDDPKVNLFQLVDDMKKRGGWYLQPQFSTDISPCNLHITMNYYATARVEEFLADLAASVGHIRANPLPITQERINAMVAPLGEDPPLAALKQASAMLGMAGTDLPEEMAMVQMALEALPDGAAEKMLIGFLNDAFA